MHFIAHIVSIYLHYTILELSIANLDISKQYHKATIYIAV